MTLVLIVMEEWKDIPGYEGMYQASNLGNIKSVQRFVKQHNGGKQVKKEHLLKPSKSKTHSYYSVVLSKNGKHKSFLVHRLVWITFNGPIPQGLEVNHLNENTLDNNLTNLNLLSHKDNMNWGTHNERVIAPQRKPVLQLSKDNQVIQQFSSTAQASRETGICQGDISRCCNGKHKTAGGFKWEYA